MPATASVFIHLGIVGAVLLVSTWTPLPVPVLMADLVVLDTPDPTPAVIPTPRPPAPVRDRRPITPPRPTATPMPPEPPARPEPAPEPPRTTVPEPPPVATPAAPSPSPAATEPSPIASPPAAPTETSGASVSAPPDPGGGTFAVSAPTIASPTPSTPAPTSGPAVAAILPDGITHQAIPRGGYQHRPAYPSSARRLGIQGTTMLSVLVADDGRVAEVVVKRSAGHPDLDRAAADAVRRWRFEPARRGTEAVAMWVLLPVEFRLQ